MVKNILRFQLVIVTLIFLVSPGFSQTGIENDSLRNDSISPLFDFHSPTFDKLNLTSFYLHDIEEKRPFMDSLLSKEFLQYNPIFEQRVPFLYQGNNGTASIPLTQLLPFESGFDPGFHAYDIHSMSLDSFRWYRTKIPFSDLYFNNGPSTEEFRVMAKFSKEFPGNISFNIDYERIIENGDYQYQATKQSMLSIGFWHRLPDNKSNTFLTYVGNIHQQQNNGGIVNTSYFGDPNYSIRSGIPVNLNNALTRYQNNHYSILNHYLLNQKPDSLVFEPVWKWTLVSQLDYENGFFKYFDEGTGSNEDISYYGPLLTDDLGIRHYITYDRIGLEPGIDLRNKSDLQLRVGAGYDLWFIHQEPLETTLRHDLFVYGKLSLPVFDQLKTNLDLEYHTGTGRDSYEGSASFEYSLGQWLSIYAKQRLVNASPSLVQSAFYLTGSESPVQNNDFLNVRSSETYLDLFMKRFGFQAGLSYKLVDNYIYFDPELLFDQLDASFSLLDIHVKQHLRFKNFNWEIQGHLYFENSPVLDLPLYHVFSTLYFNGPILKNSFVLNTGFEIRLMEGFNIPGYQASVGQFYYQNDFVSSTYPWIDFFISFKVESFRFFARTENILNAFFPDDIHYQIYLHPQNDFKPFRFGVRWYFLD